MRVLIMVGVLGVAACGGAGVPIEEAGWSSTCGYEIRQPAAAAGETSPAGGAVTCLAPARGEPDFYFGFATPEVIVRVRAPMRSGTLDLAGDQLLVSGRLTDCQPWTGTAAIRADSTWAVELHAACGAHRVEADFWATR